MKIFYIHGLGSTCNGYTVTRLKELLTDHEIVARDFPIDPVEGLRAASEWTYDCDLVVGTSLGGFYAQFADCPKVLINPALQPTRDIMAVEGKGTFEYFGPREDGVQSFTLDDEYYADLKMIENMCYSSAITPEDVATTKIIFGTEDEELGDTNHQFAADIYGTSNTYLFEGMGHRMEDKFMDQLIDIILGNK